MSDIDESEKHSSLFGQSEEAAVTVVEFVVENVSKIVMETELQRASLHTAAMQSLSQIFNVLDYFCTAAEVDTFPVYYSDLITIITEPEPVQQDSWVRGSIPLRGSTGRAYPWEMSTPGPRSASNDTASTRRYTSRRGSGYGSRSVKAVPRPVVIYEMRRTTTNMSSLICSLNLKKKNKKNIFAKHPNLYRVLLAAIREAAHVGRFDVAVGGIERQKERRKERFEAAEAAEKTHLLYLKSLSKKYKNKEYSIEEDGTVIVQETLKASKPVTNGVSIHITNFELGNPSIVEKNKSKKTKKNQTKRAKTAGALKNPATNSNEDTKAEIEEDRFVQLRGGARKSLLESVLPSPGVSITIGSTTRTGVPVIFPSRPHTMMSTRRPSFTKSIEKEALISPLEKTSSRLEPSRPKHPSEKSNQVRRISTTPLHKRVSTASNNHQEGKKTLHKVE